VKQMFKIRWCWGVLREVFFFNNNIIIPFLAAFDQVSAQNPVPGLLRCGGGASSLSGVRYPGGWIHDCDCYGALTKLTVH